MDRGIRIASSWRLKINLSIYEALNADNGYAASDCIMAIPSGSGFLLTAFHKEKTERHQGFIPESVAISLRGLLPNLHMRILEAQNNRQLPRQDAAREESLFRTPMQFYMTAGMSVADLLANHFSEAEMTGLKDIMSRNQDRYPINRILCEGLERAIKLVQTGDGAEINRIVCQHASSMLHLHDGFWFDIEELHKDDPEKESLIRKGKVDIFANYGASYPFLLRITDRFCKQTSAPNIDYPYSGRQLKTIYVCMTADDFLGAFLYPMETSSEMFRRQHYIDNYGIAPAT